MLIHVRTTLVIEDRLFREAKRRAASRGITLSQLVSEALRAALDRTSSPAREYAMVTYGTAGAGEGHEPADLAAALEDEDRARLGK